MLALYTAPAGLALAGCMASADPLAYLAVRIKGLAVTPGARKAIEAAGGTIEE